jgi:DNA-binding transcriptional LysR family regulator
VQRYFALEEEVKTLHEEVAGRVSVASIYSVGLSHMNQFIQGFLRLYPKANVRIQYQHPRRVVELVESDQVDLGLVSYPKSSRTIKANMWREEPMVFVSAPEHSLGGREKVSLADLHGLDLIGFDADLEIRQEIDRALAAAGSEVRVVMEFDNTETIKRAVEINAGAAVLPAPTVDREVAAGTLVARPLAGLNLTRPIGIIQRRGKELGKTARRFMQLLQTAGGDKELPREISSDGKDALGGFEQSADDLAADCALEGCSSPAHEGAVLVSTTAATTSDAAADNSGSRRAK